MHTMIRSIIFHSLLSFIFVLPVSGMDWLQGLRTRLFKKQPEYTIMLMWLNRKLNPEQRYIHPSDTPEEFEKNLGNHLIVWARGNPRSTVQLWYDSALTPAQAITNTQAYIDAHHKKSNPAPITLQDIRSLQTVQKNDAIFSDKVPVYFRADLSRVIASIEVLKKTKKTCIYADIDIKPMAEKELFDQKTKENLKDFGICIGRPPDDRWENNFHIMEYRPNLIKATQKILINRNIRHAHGRLQPNSSYKYIEVERVYRSYKFMLNYFYSLEKLGTLQMGGKIQDVKELCAMLDNGYPMASLSTKCKLEPDMSNPKIQDLLARKILPYDTAFNDWGYTYIPVKDVVCPPRSENYYS